MGASSLPVRLLLAGNLSEQLVSNVSMAINQTSLFHIEDSGPVNHEGRRRDDAFYIDEAIDLLMVLRRNEYISLILTAMPILDDNERQPFGLAVEGGPGLLGASIVSTNRLLATETDSKESEVLATSRVTKESLHELGHAMGLVHCRSGFCGMRKALHPFDVDARQPTFCPKCLLDLELRRRKLHH